MVTRLLIQNVVWIVCMAAILFPPAGTVRWAGGWVFLVVMACGGVGIGLWLARRHPELLAERLRSLWQRGQAAWDKLLLSAIIVLWCAWMVLMALDAARFRWSHVPAWVQVAGTVGILGSYYVSIVVFRENPYAAAVVKVQKERGHSVISTGPYRFVRHPMYAGAIPFFVGTPMLLGSWYGLAVVPILIGALAVRIVVEERLLRRELEGYVEYAARVRYRMVPGVW